MSRIMFEGIPVNCPICEKIYGECKHTYKDIFAYNKKITRKFLLERRLLNFLNGGNYGINPFELEKENNK